MPAQAGIQEGWTGRNTESSLDSGLRRNDEKENFDFE